jgi:two-component system C4-dicarboxylate transport sensor histidine kinase DctB
LLWPLEHLAERYYRSELASQNRQTLDLYVANLLGTLHRYEVLPQILGDLPALRAVLGAPDDGVTQGNANRLLKNISAQTGAEVMYLMDTSGKTLAASNWDKHDSFVGRNFAFRPYFSEAMAGRLGAFSAWAPRRPNAATSSPPPCARARKSSACWWSRSTSTTPKACGAKPRNSCC